MPLAPATRWIGAKADTAPPPCALATATSSSSKTITIQHYVYFSVRDDGDNGSIIDLAMQRKSLNLGQARKDPRPWIGKDAAILPAFPALPISAKDRLKVDSAFRRIVDASRHSYLEDERRVPTAPVGSSAMDSATPCFHILTWRGLCCFEIRNRDFTGWKTRTISSCSPRAPSIP